MEDIKNKIKELEISMWKMKENQFKLDFNVQHG